MELVLENGRLHWVKHKYAVDKRRSGYRSSHNDGLRGMKRQKQNEKVKLQIKASQPKKMLFIDASGKKKMIVVG